MRGRLLACMREILSSTDGIEVFRQAAPVFQHWRADTNFLCPVHCQWVMALNFVLGAGTLRDIVAEIYEGLP